ncbi:hypothetical protein RHGRI_007325 [Rhododendron griersonianum]|uniref:Uncharacterized protein n=1 Tax=Rhododendron griersonianum TaxID=479676 RepID=A0AAV6KZG5_9ERIC|nr:hypothetical protein RHGRI_007325 [Rhododendron griersonianum]
METHLSTVPFHPLLTPPPHFAALKFKSITHSLSLSLSLSQLESVCLSQRPEPWPWVSTVS